MKILPINRYRFYQTLQPQLLLKKITSKSTTGCLQVFTASGSWSIYVEEGKLVYACCADQMFELLYKNLQHLSQKVPALHNGIKEQLRAIFETGIENQAIPNPDYLAICWLVNQKYITSAQAGILVEQLALEVLESFLLPKEGSYEFTHESFLDDMPKFCHLDMRLLVERCQKRSHHVSIPSTKSERFDGDVSQAQSTTFGRRYPENHQSPTTFASKTEKTASSGQQHLHVVSPTRSQSAIPTQQPLPKPNLNNVLHHPVNSNNSNRTLISQPPADKKPYTVLCIDDSPMVVNAIRRFLDDQLFSVVGINDPLKALMQIIRLKPDLILLDIEMPNLDGYELCALVRKHSHFKNTPIIMVTGRTGFIDKARAKIVRASGYLSKPFTQAGLLKEVFQHIK